MRLWGIDIGIYLLVLMRDMIKDYSCEDNIHNFCSINGFYINQSMNLITIFNFI